MATGLVTVVDKNLLNQVGLIARGTATQLQGNGATANLRVASSENLVPPGGGARGIHALALVAATNATTPAPPAGDTCWPAIEAGFLGGDGVTMRFHAVAATRGLDGTIAADNVTTTQCVYSPSSVNAGAQLTSSNIFGTTGATFAVTTGCVNPPHIVMIPDAIRVAFFVTHVAAASGQWNFVWRLYAYWA
jgi:hypothetical protein